MKRLMLICSATILVTSIYLLGGGSQFSSTSMPTSSDLHTSGSIGHINEGNPEKLNSRSIDHKLLIKKNPASQVIYDHTNANYVTKFGDRAIVRIGPDITEEEIKIYNENHVLPFNRVVDVTCHQSLESKTFEQHQKCIFIRERPVHPFTSLSIDELEALATTDPIAALVLSEKAPSAAEQLYWTLSATALSSKSGPLLTYAYLERRMKRLSSNKNTLVI